MRPCVSYWRFVVLSSSASILIVASGLSCQKFTTRGNGNGSGSQSASSTDTATIVYRAELKSINDSTSGHSAKGTATIKWKGDSLFIQVLASGLEPNTMHMQHLHGFPGGEKTSCASLDQDRNGDSIIDLIETQSVSGITMIPLNKDPAGLELTAKTYPSADMQGAFSYSDTVIVSKLVKELRKKYGIDTLRLDNKILYIHGISPNTSLPQSVQSLPGLPSHSTLPVACGKLEDEDSGFLPF